MARAPRAGFGATKNGTRLFRIDGKAQAEKPCAQNDHRGILGMLQHTQTGSKAPLA